MEKLPRLIEHFSIAINDQIELRVVGDNEANRLFEITDGNRKYLSEFLPWVKVVEDELDSLDHIKKSNEEWENGTKYSFGIYSDNDMVGRISLMNLESDKRPEIGYWISEEYSGRGITSKAAMAVEDFGFHSLGLDEIILRARVDNAGSNAIAKKPGYTLEGEERDSEDDELMNIWSKKNGK